MMYNMAYRIQLLLSRNYLSALTVSQNEVVVLKLRELPFGLGRSMFSCDNGAGRLLIRGAVFLCGLLFSRAAVFESYCPFGVSLAAAVPFPYVFFAFAGSAVGYIVFPAAGASFRYIAACAAVIAIRWTLSDIKKLNSHSFYSSIVAILPVFATGVAVMSVSGFDKKGFILYGTEALLAGAAAFFISRTSVMLSGTRSLGMLMPQELASLILTGCVALLALSGINIWELSLGRTAAILVILFAARYGGIQGGAVAGIAAGAVLSLKGSSFAFIGACFAFGGLASGLFSPLGRLAGCGAFMLAAVISGLQTGTPERLVIMLYEIIIASVIFLFLPENAASFFRAVFVSKNDDEHTEGLRRSVIMRLDFASKALSNVSEEVEAVSEKLSKIVTPTLTGVYEKAVEDTCSRCGMKIFCWEHPDGVSMELLEKSRDTLCRKGELRASDLCDEFRRKCCRTTEMAGAVNRYYQSYLSSRAAQKRIDEVRQVVAGQFCGLGGILEEMAREYSDYEVFDNDLAQKITVKLKDLGLQPTAVSCRIDYLGRMTIEAEASDSDGRKLRRSLLVHEMNRLCGRHFDTPGVTNAFGTVRIMLCERPCLDAEIASGQHISGDGKLCGDHFSYFFDGSGKLIVILSDGMGTGGRAAVDGGMASGIMEKLIRAGLGYDCSLKVVNAALLVKSEDESLATLDVLSLDLYSGKTEFLKAGAALSFIRKGSDMFRVQTPSLPAGILPQIDFSCTEDDLSDGDIIVMVSDGAIACGEDWIENIILSFEKGSMQELADRITSEAITRRRDGHDDDISVIAVRVLNN